MGNGIILDKQAEQVEWENERSRKTSLLRGTVSSVVEHPQVVGVHAFASMTTIYAAVSLLIGIVYEYKTWRVGFFSCLGLSLLAHLLLHLV